MHLFLLLLVTAAPFATAPKGTMVWTAGFENGDCFPEVKNFGRDLVQKVNGEPSPLVDVTWQSVIRHSGKYAEKEHTTRDRSNLDKGASHRGYCFQSWRSTNGTPIQTPIVVTAWVYLGKFDSRDWLSFITLISTPTQGYPYGSILTVDMLDSRELTVWCQPKHQNGPAFNIEQTKRPKAKVPLNQWVKLQVYVDWNGSEGALMVWQNDELVIDAPKKDIGPRSTLEKGHFGLYSGPNLNEITLYNDDLSVERVPPTTFPNRP